MGLFGKKKDRVPESCVLSVGGEWQKPEKFRIYVPEGDDSVQVYTYDARPLGSGTRWRLKVEPRDYVLKSIYTGTVIDTENDKTCAVSYNGQVVGTVKLPRYRLVLLAEQGILLELDAFSAGTVDGLGIQDVRAVVPDGNSGYWMKGIS